MNLVKPSMKIAFQKPGLRALAFLIVIVLQACTTEQPHQVLSGRIMGTTWSVQIAGTVQTQEQQQALARIEQLLSEVDQSMSTYKPDSELNRINAAGAGSYQLSAPLFAVIDLAKDIYLRSDGAFDVTVGPLVTLWGFGSDPAPEPATVPEPAAIQAVLKNTGMGSVQLDKKERRVTLAEPVTLDLSAIAKGYAVDKVALSLIKSGLRNFLVEVGGELRASGVNKKGNHWVIGIETPVEDRRQAYTGVMLKQKAIATSGDYRNFFEVQGKRYSHTLDPRSGYPVEHKVASVTVLADSAAAADGWATALNVLGLDAGLQLAEREGLAAFFIVREGESFVSRESSAYTAYNNTVP